MSNYPASQVTTQTPVINQAFAFTVPVIDLSTGSPVTGGVASATVYVSGDFNNETVGINNPPGELLNPSGQGTGVLAVRLAASEMNYSLVNVRVVSTSTLAGIHTCLTSSTCIRGADLGENDRSFWRSQLLIRIEQALVQLAASELNARNFNGSIENIFDTSGNVLLTAQYQLADYLTTRGQMS